MRNLVVERYSDSQFAHRIPFDWFVPQPKTGNSKNEYRNFGRNVIHPATFQEIAEEWKYLHVSISLEE